MVNYGTFPGNFSPYSDPWASDTVATDSYLRDAVCSAPLPNAKIHSQWVESAQHTWKLHLTVEIPEVDELYNFLEAAGYSPRQEGVSVIGAVKRLKDDLELALNRNATLSSINKALEADYEKQTRNDKELVASLLERVYNIEEEAELLMSLNNAAQEWKDHLNETSNALIANLPYSVPGEDANNHD